MPIGTQIELKIYIGSVTIDLNDPENYGSDIFIGDFGLFWRSSFSPTLGVHINDILFPTPLGVHINDIGNLSIHIRDRDIHEFDTSIEFYLFLHVT